MGRGYQASVKQRGVWAVIRVMTIALALSISVAACGHTGTPTTPAPGPEPAPSTPTEEPDCSPRAYFVTTAPIWSGPNADAVQFGIREKGYGNREDEIVKVKRIVGNRALILELSHPPPKNVSWADVDVLHFDDSCVSRDLLSQAVAIALPGKSAFPAKDFGRVRDAVKDRTAAWIQPGFPGGKIFFPCADRDPVVVDSIPAEPTVTPRVVTPLPTVKGADNPFRSLSKKATATASAVSAAATQSTRTSAAATVTAASERDLSQKRQKLQDQIQQVALPSKQVDLSSCTLRSATILKTAAGLQKHLVILANFDSPVAVPQLEAGDLQGVDVTLVVSCSDPNRCRDRETAWSKALSKAAAIRVTQFDPAGDLGRLLQPARPAPGPPATEIPPRAGKRATP